jgi:hypothetical protein
LIDLSDQPPARVSFGRKDRIVLEHVVEIDVPAGITLEHRDKSAMVDAGPKLWVVLFGVHWIAS